MLEEAQTLAVGSNGFSDVFLLEGFISFFFLIQSRLDLLFDGHGPPRLRLCPEAQQLDFELHAPNKAA